MDVVQQALSGSATADCCNIEAVSSLLALVEDPVVMVDMNGLIAGWSQGAVDLLGYAPVEVIGRRWADLHSDGESALLSSADKIIHAQQRAAVMHDAGGVPACRLIRLHRVDVTTGQPPLSAAQSREFRQLLDGGPLGIWHLDADYRLIFANRAAFALAPREPTDIAGRHISDVVGLEVYLQLRPALHRAMAGTLTTVRVTVPARNGTAGRPFVVQILPRRDIGGSVAGCLAVVLAAEGATGFEWNGPESEPLHATLTREVAHRVNNSLQGVIGLLRYHAAHDLPAGQAIDQAVARLMAVAVAFGLAGRHGNAQIYLCDLVTGIAGSVGEISHNPVRVRLSGAVAREPIALSERFGPNVSLIIHELVSNAVKHGAGAGGPRDVWISVDRDSDAAVLRVVNESGQLPPGFSLETDSGLGPGLSLIKALVPPEYGSLSIDAGPDGVCARLTLRPPVLAAHPV